MARLSLPGGGQRVWRAGSGSAVLPGGWTCRLEPGPLLARRLGTWDPQRFQAGSPPLRFLCQTINQRFGTLSVTGRGCLGASVGGADERGHSRSRGEPAGGAGDEGRVEKRWVTLLNWMERERASGWAPGRMWGSGVGVQPGRMGAGGWRLRPGPWWVCLGTLRPLIQ